MEKLGAASGAERVEAGLESAFEFIWTHDGRLRRRIVARVV